MEREDDKVFRVLRKRFNELISYVSDLDFKIKRATEWKASHQKAAEDIQSLLDAYAKEEINENVLNAFAEAIIMLESEKEEVEKKYRIVT